MTRTNQSTTTTKVDVAQLSGWNLTFRYEIMSGATNPSYVSCTGSKPESMQHLNAYISAQNESVNFSQVECDTTLAEAILTEMRTILTAVL